MAKEQRISARSWSPAEPASVYQLLHSGESWPCWSPIGSFELEREGPGGGEGVGARRLFRTGPFKSHEEIVADEPDRRFGYTLRRGLPLRDYRADIELEGRDGGTAIHWHSSFRPKIPGTGAFYRWFLGRFLQRCVDGLAHGAAARSPEASPQRS
jgi:hypothetical protein